MATKKRVAGKRPAAAAKPNIGDKIIEGLQQAIAYERGELAGVRVTRVPLTARETTVAPPRVPDRREIVDIRERMQVSQTVFAQVLNVSPNTVRAWEQGKRRPEGAAVRLLQLAYQEPLRVARTASIQFRAKGSGDAERKTSPARRRK